MPPKKQVPKGPSPKGPSFDEIIQSDRQKKQNELLASQILGKDKNKKGRRASAPGSGSGSGALGRAQPAKPGSLASRIAAPGKLKRSASASFRTSQPQSQPQHKTKAKTNPTPATVGAARSREKPARKKTQKEHPHSKHLLSLVQNARDANPHPHPKTKAAKSGLSIKGASGPFIVVGSNFSPGTSAADIQSALEARTGPMLSCRVISHSPAVTAEIAYAEKEIAENTVANFDNQWADGRKLTFRLNVGGDTTHVNTQNSFNNLREQADRNRRNRRAEPQVQDGTFGFGEEGEALRYNLPQSNLYSDQMMVDTQQNNQGRRRH
ncbi:hypothetical protein N7509_005595 [Penicillium cosmopolitanum]|uniref:RRM domain-containing protein n=1 Tax=Penicillium cosmopolitanum TaxID=1131564 RepID=A0A9W9W2Q7_9EURO|nr:uncharacterized protein N7509_005595 [Penicillium cosmopolitanum]KAJ5397482.1 hypothetical protein N7509_005595 [Penicillium cosmopolitanum]